MRTVRLVAWVVLSAWSAGRADVPLTQPVVLAAGADKALDALEARGKTLVGFDCGVTLTELSTAYGSTTVRYGHVWYEKAAGGTRLHVVFEKKKIGDKTFAEKREYLLEGNWVTDRDYTSKTETRRQIAAAGKEVDLFQLGKGGPFPLPIGQPKASVVRAFEVSPQPADKDDPAGSTHLLLKPRAKTKLAEQFQSVDVWVDPGTNMPVRVETLDAKGAIDKTADLTGLNVNPPMPATAFELADVPDDWRKSEVPLGQ